MRIDEFLRNKHGEKRMPADVDSLHNDLSVLKEMVDDFYSYVFDHCTRNKVISDLYLTIDEQINEIMKNLKGD